MTVNESDLYISVQAYNVNHRTKSANLIYVNLCWYYGDIDLTSYCIYHNIKEGCATQKNVHPSTRKYPCHWVLALHIRNKISTLTRAYIHVSRGVQLSGKNKFFLSSHTSNGPHTDVITLDSISENSHDPMFVSVTRNTHSTLKGVSRATINRLFKMEQCHLCVTWSAVNKKQILIFRSASSLITIVGILSGYC